MSEKKTSGLGRGLAALLDEAVRPSTSEGAPKDAPEHGVREVEIGRIQPNPAQPRAYFDEEAIAELAESIAQRGVLQPILLRPDGENFQLVAGERRWRAAQRARLHTIPAIVRDIDDATSAEIALIENVQRQDLNAIEEAEGYSKLIDRYGHTQDALAKIVHKSRSHIANLLRLLDLPDGVKQLLLHGEISMGHARAVATADDPEKLARQIVSDGLSVRQTEALAKARRTGDAKTPATVRPPNQPVDADLAALERQLGDMLGLKVKVAHSGRGGTVSLSYSSLDQLDMICQRLSGEPI
ncbi:ParB/RepB/Spo0J family partition protein [Sphingomonas sabuli]|uniref:ParB/RepB/Spo0J family partition protein n=1 Tax=Sphingomonas sabuli TaxID=2764186 RepID=A0A7G9L0E3_9SPHN|nr:ParB/RepB/Spo0J family partition protein [Sphingomonas sabuli]QNM82092.1 ParB/RepB/Spo0J family partition protein [Sphingomonas sabuli]